MILTDDIGREIADALDSRLPETGWLGCDSPVDRSDPSNLVLTMANGEVFIIRVVRS